MQGGGEGYAYRMTIKIIIITKTETKLQKSVHLDPGPESHTTSSYPLCMRPWWRVQYAHNFFRETTYSEAVSSISWPSEKYKVCLSTNICTEENVLHTHWTMLLIRTP